MSKQTATNAWNDGLNKDLNPIITPNTVLTDNLNGTFITYNGNEFSLQNDMGNVYTTRLSEGFYPIGVTEYGGILYIVSVNESNSIRLIVNRTENADLSESIVVIKNIIKPTYDPFNDNDALDMLSEKGWLVPNSEIGNLLLDLLNTYIESEENVLFVNADFNIEPSTKFEIGSFPSLSPSSINVETDGQEFDYEYRPFYNLLRNINGEETIVPFSTTGLRNYDLSHPVTIEVQPSYDGSVNLILIDDKNPPRLINSGFAVLNTGLGKFTKRNQGVKTNYYDEAKLDILTQLINVSPKFTIVDLGTFTESEEDGKIFEQNGVLPGGQLKGGNYTFYFKFGDEDGNKTDIICESGIVSVFKGTIGDPTTISGAFNDELTDKLVKLTLSDVDTNYSRIYVYYTREYCDLNGYRLVECKSLVEPFKINNSTEVIVISGTELVEDVSIEELNIYYHTIASAKAISQQQNMLFLGNVTKYEPESEFLQNYSYEIKVGIQQAEDIGGINPINYSAQNRSEYYDPHNIYYNLGYWPNEIYRFGIVYIKSDGSITQVFNLKGCSFTNINDNNLSENHISDYSNSKDGIFIDNTENLDNLCGVFKVPDANLLNEGQVRPLYFTFDISDELVENFTKLNIVGYFIVRQKRIPITICQGLGIGIDKNAFIPMLQDKNGKYVAESFITKYSETDNEEDAISRQLVYNPLNLDENIVTGDSDALKIYYCVNSWKKRVFNGLFHKRKEVTVYNVKLIGPYGDNLDYVWYEFTITNDLQMAIDMCNSAYNMGRDTINPNGKYPFDNNTNNNISNRNFIAYSFNQNTNISANKDRRIENVQENGYGLLSVEAMLNPRIQSLLNGTKFIIKSVNDCEIKEDWPVFIESKYSTSENNNEEEAKLIYIPSNTPLKYVDNVGFSTQAGDGINTKAFSFLETDEQKNTASNDKIVRGNFTPFIGVISKNSINANTLYNIQIPHSNDYKSEFVVRANNPAEFFAVSDKTLISTPSDIFRGDCFTNTVTIRMHRNFIDQTVPIADKIIKADSWRKYYHGYTNIPNENDSDEERKTKTQWDEINIGDLNTVSLGHWITFKCLSNSNLGLRSEDTFNTDEMALMGNSRSFYPLYGISTATGTKLPDSTLLNDGYNATVSRRRNTIKQNTPYDKNEFSTRIMFSNISVSDSFTNGYRTFQGLSYQDYTKQYGAIIKLLPYGNNLFCVFEHGLAIIPINEKALLQTTTEQTIHIYGHGVLPDQLSIISQDFGSIWADSIIRTPVGIYGVDTSTKKIWRYSDKNGLETISDMKIQRFLNDNINIGLTRQETLGYTNVKTHFNNYKGDVMFTFYHTNENGKKEWNLCYNERQGMWITRYSWIPLFSSNIDNTFYTMPLTEYTEHNDISIWKHGRTGNDKGFKPSFWYGQQHPFEFEFVVNDPAGVHKIFEDLMIISNNVQPKEIEFQIVGDSYLFNRARIYHDSKNIYGNVGEDKPYDISNSGYNKDNFSISDFKPMFYNARVEYDPVLDEYSMIITQQCKNKETYGVRLGNIQYKEDGWYTNIEPLRYNANLNNPNVSSYNITDKFASAKLRDKWVKIRIKYTGDQLAIINGVLTFENISYS